MRQPSRANNVNDGFWISSNLVAPLEQIIKRGAYCGKIVGSEKEDSDGGGPSAVLLVDETLTSQWKRLPELVLTIEFYTEADCRSLFKKIASAVQIFHER